MPYNTDTGVLVGGMPAASVMSYLLKKLLVGSIAERPSANGEAKKRRSAAYEGSRDVLYDTVQM